MKKANQNHENEVLENRFFAINIALDRCEAIFNMTLDGILSLLNLIKENHENLILNKSNLLNISETKNCLCINTLIIKNTLDNNQPGMVMNYSSSEEVLYIITNNSGMKYFEVCLESLKEGLINGKTEDISLMTDDWGGDGLINKQIIKDSNVICHLRLYGII